MIAFIFSLDYEIHGDGSGDFGDIVLEPTEKMLSIFERYGAKLSIMVEVAEILALKKYSQFKPVVNKVEGQLKQALARNHDIQLHLHPQWFNAVYEREHWFLRNEHYSLVNLPKETISDYITIGKEYLEAIGTQVKQDYKCIAFRAGHWLIQPSRNVVDSLEEAGFLYDTSIFKWAKFQKVGFSSDFTEAYSHFSPWVVDPDDITKKADRTGLYEIPIFTRKVFFPKMLTHKRIALRKRAVLAKCKPVDSKIRHFDFVSLIREARSGISQLGFFYPKKFDFNQMTFKEMKDYTDYAISKLSDSEKILPIVLIGHSKDFIDDGSLQKLFEYINSRYKDKVKYITFSELGRIGPKNFL